MASACGSAWHAPSAAARSLPMTWIFSSAFTVTYRADNKNESSTEPEALSPWDALGLGTEAWAASKETVWYTIFEIACWSKAAVEEAGSKYMEDKQGWIKDSQRDSRQLPVYLALIQRRSEFTVAAGWLYAGHLVRQWLNSTQAEGTETAVVSHATTKSLEPLVDNVKRNGKASRLALIAQCLAKRPSTSKPAKMARYSILSGLPYRPELGLLYNDLEHSLADNPLNSQANCSLSNSGEISVFSPFHVTDEVGYRFACGFNAEENESDGEEEEEGNATRAVILDLPLFSDYLAPHSVVQDIAAGLQADVVHITSSSIARLLECPLPLSRDGIRIPTDPISNLRFRAAERSGWLNSAANSLATPETGNARALKREYWEGINMTGSAGTDNSGGWRRFVINQFPREMDGLEAGGGAFVMAATNRPFDLDDTVLRRLPRRLLVARPPEGPERGAL
ncbi:hypothetical protein INS49_000182 [Diaporthe citri]|uniref:uncharacterized protein n=1 Tax=Diaporthe citri TaxID=83186 RepID=UPI001C81CCC0|nr:uncharacterized protein INS49_000182 [Diaporthe citri]KAG6366006.1 hypothetical protein INS49_000182 [Diaporthe citri]